MSKAMAAVDIDWPLEIHRALAAADVRQVAYVPDAGHARLIQLCQADAAMRAVSLTTEEEGVAMLAGAWLGGQRGALLMQSSGVGNCINMLSLIRACGFPLLTLVTMRGEWGEFNPWQVPMGQASEAVLKLCGATVYRLDQPERAGDMVAAAARLAFGSSVNVVVLIGQAMIGSKSFKD
jgi:sulfopyruvate decarboxylase alpha subunit